MDNALHHNANTMETPINWEKLIVVVSGILGGIFKMAALTLLDISFWNSLWKAGLTAGYCAIMSLIARQLYKWLLEPGLLRFIKWSKATEFTSWFKIKLKKRK